MIRLFVICALFIGASGFYVQQDLGLNSYYPVEFNPEQLTEDQYLNEQLQRQESELASEEQEGMKVFEEELRIPGEKPKQNDSYLCSAYYQPKEKSLISFEPVLKENAHHIILFVCEQPGIDSPVPAWDCGEMANMQNGVETQYVKGPPCASASAPIFAWSHGAGDEETKLPEGVGFPVGGLSKNQYVVLQVHYMNVPEKEDFTGVKVKFTDQPQPKTASTLLLVTGGAIKSNSRENFEAACTVDEDIEIHPLFFRVHTHRHGEKVSGWVVNEDAQGSDKWTLLGERDPQKPQLFEPVKNNSMVIKQGDILGSRCTIYNNEDHPIKIGATSEDEMCNFYLIYWTQGQALSDNICYSPGAPNYTWSKQSGLNHIPN